MTLRAVIIGLLGAVVLAGTDYLRQEVWGFSSMIGSHLPRGLFGLLVVAVLVINPLLIRYRPRWRFRASEIAIILSLTMMAGGVVGPALMESFTPTLAMPGQFNASMVGWREHGLLEMTPAALLAGGGQYDPEVLEGFLAGLGSQGQPIGIGGIPWQKWAGPLSFWLPMVLLLGLAMISLSLIVHRQWSAHERLRYPIADFVGSLITQDSQRGLSVILKSKLFWCGFVALMLLHMLNGLNAWLPQYVIMKIPMVLDFSAVGLQFKQVRSLPWWIQVFRPVLIPSAIAFTFFLASDVGLTLGLAHIIFMLVIKLIFEPFGLPRYEADLIGGANSYVRFGGSVALGLMMLYTGRRYYSRVLMGALGLGNKEVESYSIWACRVLLLCAIGMIWLLVGIGLIWPVAVLCVLIALLTFLVISRVNAEAGLYMFRIAYMPAGIVLALFGGYALGPEALIIAGLFSVVLMANTNGAFMPYIVNALKICDDQGLKPGPVGSTAGLVFTLCLAVGIVAALWTNYNYGVRHSQGGWSTERVPKMTYNVTEGVVDKLKVTGRLEESRGLSTFGRLKSMAPSRLFNISALSGLGLVLALTMLRLRYCWWPLHPFIIVFWGTWPMAYLCVSFLIGWTIKMMLVRVGGSRTHQQGKQLMIGVIAGDVLGVLLFMLASAAYYLLTVHPGLLYRPS